MPSGQMAQLETTFKNPETSLGQKILQYVKETRIEPFAFVLAFGYVSKVFAMQQMVQDKICLQHFHQDEFYCKHLSELPNSPIKNQILAETSTYTSYYTMLSLIPAVIWCIFVGSWCDKFLGAKRLILILTALSGLAEAAALILNAYFIYIDPLYLLVSMLPAYFIGVFQSGFTAMYSYIAQNTKSEMRAVRFATVEVTTNVAVPLGRALGGWVMTLAPLGGNGQLKNYVGTYIIEIPGCIFCVLWAIFMINETQDEEIENHNSEDNDQQDNHHRLRKATSKEIFSLTELKSMWQTIIKKRPGHEKLIFWLLIFCHLSTFLTMYGFHIYLLPLVEQLYQWDATQLSYASAIETVIKPICLLVFVPVLSRYFLWNDLQLAMLGATSGVLLCLIFGSFWTPTAFYAASIIGAFLTTASISIRSFITKFYPSDETAKMIALLMVLESVVPTLSSVFHSSIYNASVSFYPTLSFHLCALLLIISTSIYMTIEVSYFKKILNFEKQQK